MCSSFVSECGNGVEMNSGIGFEGFEKRLEVEFHPAAIFTDPEGRGLRALSRANLDLMLDAAKCTIVSHLSNAHFDSYVLSESSLFVSPLKVVLKTCGTTQLLKAIPILLDFAAGLSMKVRGAKYTRGTFMFPSVQPFPHGCFGDEVDYLEQYFGKLGSGGRWVMGNAAQFPCWHLYTACDEKDDFSCEDRTYTVEMCMTKLDAGKAAAFFNEDGAKTGSDMTAASGITSLLPQSELCDFAFEPCGYSMNSIEGSAHSTIHVTPESNFSFASFETMGYGPKDVDVAKLLDNVTSVFKPASFSLFLHASAGVDGADRAGGWGKPICPTGYLCDGSTRQELPGGGVAVFHTFKEEGNRAVIAVQSLALLTHVDEPLYFGDFVPENWRKESLYKLRRNTKANGDVKKLPTTFYTLHSGDKEYQFFDEVHNSGDGSDSCEEDSMSIFNFPNATSSNSSSDDERYF
jgi:S-adenosylmethionine decarboxylase